MLPHNWLQNPWLGVRNFHQICNQYAYEPICFELSAFKQYIQYQLLTMKEWNTFNLFLNQYQILDEPLVYRSILAKI